MKCNYVLETETGEPVVWRGRDTLPEFRIFEDGYVAKAHQELASKLFGYRVILMKLGDYSSAVTYLRSKTREYLWIHHFTLPYKYIDRYEKKD